MRAQAVTACSFMNCSSPGRIAPLLLSLDSEICLGDVPVDDRLAHPYSNDNSAISYSRDPPVLSDKSTTMENSRQESFKKVTEYANRISNP